MEKLRDWMARNGVKMETIGQGAFVAKINEALRIGNVDIHAGTDYALRFASKVGYIDVVKLLIDNGANVDAINGEPLYLSSAMGHLEVVSFLINKGADVHANGDKALRCACRYGNLEVVKFLINAGADIHACKDESLRYACKSGYVEIARLLIKAGADIHAHADAALRYACASGELEIVRLLINAGANIHSGNDLAFEWASGAYKYEIKKILKSSKIRRDDYIDDSLNYSDCEFLSQEALFTKVEHLLSDGFGFSIISYRLGCNYALLNIAVRLDYPEVVELLMGVGFSLNDVAYLAGDYGSIEVIKFLLERYDVGERVLSGAAWYNQLNIVKYLINERFVDVHANKDVALSHASYFGHVELAKFLIDKGADVHANEDKALRLASENGHVEIVKLLIGAGANVHACDPYKRNRLIESGGHYEWTNDEALMEAIRNKHVEVVKLLIEAGADFSAPPHSQRVISLAFESSDAELVEVLLKAGADIPDGKFEWAIYENKINFAEPLLHLGANGNHRCRQVFKSLFDDPKCRDKLISYFGTADVEQLLRNAEAT